MNLLSMVKVQNHAYLYQLRNENIACFILFFTYLIQNSKNKHQSRYKIYFTNLILQLSGKYKIKGEIR